MKWILLVVVGCGATSSTIPTEETEPYEASGTAETTGTPSTREMSSNEWPIAPGLHQVERELAGISTRVSVHLPPTFDGDEPHPLAIVLHYGGEPSPFYGAGLLQQLFIEGLSDLDAILVAPDSLEGSWSSSPNQNMLPALLTAIAEAYSVDQEKILLTGYSMGGVGTWAIAATDLLPITAAMPVSSAPADPLPSIPTHAVHSTGDEVFELTPVRAAIDRLTSQGVPAELTIVEGLGHYDITEHTAAVRTAARWIKEQW